MRRNLPYLGKRSLIAHDSYGSLSWQLADENSATSSSRHRRHCDHHPSAAPLQSFIWSTWNARISSSSSLLLFFLLLTIRTTKWKYKIHVSLVARRKRGLESPRQSMERAEWQDRVEKHTRQFRNLYTISPLVETQTTLLASHFSGWHTM